MDDGANRATVERYTEAFFLSHDLDALEATLDPEVGDAPEWRAAFREPVPR